MRVSSEIKAVAPLAALIALAPAQALAEHGPRPLEAIVKVLKGVTGEAREIDRDAMRLYESVPRAGSCAERRARFQAMLPDALRLARLARDIGETSQEAKMKAAGLGTLDLGGGRTAYYERNGRRYAEVQVDEERRQVIAVFNGTRLAVQRDVSTDVLSFIGVETGYYRWASALVAQVAREHPGLEVIATGQSLGGGLAIYAVLQNPGAKGFAFNPAGLALLTWAQTSAAERARANAAITVVSTRNAGHIEPVTALSFAGRSVLPGHVFVVEVDEPNPAALHAAKTVVTALEQVSASQAGGDACEGDLGVLAD